MTHPMRTQSNSRESPLPADPWSTALSISAVVALVEGVAIALLYRDLPFERGPFLVFFVLTHVAATGLVAGVSGWTLVRVFGPYPRSVALGMGAGWALLLVVRGYRALVNFESFARGDWRRVALVMLAALAGGVAVAATTWIALRLFRPRIPGAVAALVVLALIAVAVALLRSPLPEFAPGIPETRSAPPSAVLDPTETNILLIVVDTLRADHTSPYGYARETSPRMRELSSRGVTFERCVTQRTNTTPAMATMMTGLYPPTVGVVDAGDVLSESHTTLGEILQERGFRTAAFCANGMTGPRYNLDQGIERFELILPDEQIESRAINQEALSWLEEQGSEPFFLWLHYKDPHWPYELPESHAGLFADDGGASTPSEVESEIANYDAEIFYNDESLGQIFDTLQRLDLWDDTLVILTADHGESLGEHDYYYSHGAYCYEPTAHVPLIMAHPRFGEPRRVEATIGLVDLLPTLLELFGIGADPALQGNSFAGALVEGSFDPRPYNYVLGGGLVGYHNHAITTDGHKLVFDVDGRWVYLDVAVQLAAKLWQGRAPDHLYHLRVVRRELFDLAADPGEEHNLAGSEPALEAELDARLWDWLDRVYRGWMPPDPYRDPDILEDLRSLGYL